MLIRQGEHPTYPEKALCKPRVVVSSVKEAPQEMEYKGSSAVGKDDLLGTIAYSAAGEHYWSYTYEVTKQVTHKSVTGSPLVSLTIEQPQSLSVAKGLLKIVASAASSSGTIVSIGYRIHNGEWLPVELGNETEKTVFARTMMARVGTIEWDTTKASNGPHDISIMARDSNGLTENKTVTVIVDNSGPQFTGYSQILNFALVVAIVIGVVGALWMKGARTRRVDVS